MLLFSFASVVHQSMRLALGKRQKLRGNARVNGDPDIAARINDSERIPDFIQSRPFLGESDRQIFHRDTRAERSFAGGRDVVDGLF